MGQTQLAYLTAGTHGLTEEAALLEDDLMTKNIDIPTISRDNRPIIPPTPIRAMEDNWPQLAIHVGPFDAQIIATNKDGSAKTISQSSVGAKATRAAATFLPTLDLDKETEGEAWGVEGDLLLDEHGNPEIEETINQNEGDDGWDVSVQCN